MNWKNRNVFITGAAGFLGSWMASALLENKANVTALIRDVPSKLPEYLKKTFADSNIVYGSVTDYQLVERIFNEYDIDTCFHLAAQAIVRAANRSPLSTFESNIKGTWNVLEAARNSHVERLVVASSDKAYGEHKELPYTEDFSLNALHPYDASKACADILARTYYYTYGIPVAVTRCANIYGGGDLNFSRIIPDTIRSIIFNKNPLIRSDGTPVRDYIYIKDVVDAYLILGEKLSKVKGEAFNFGTNNPISVLDMVNKIIKISGKKLRPVIKGKGKIKGEIEKQYLSSEKAKKLLRWTPRYSLEEGLRHTIRWYKNYFK